MCIIDRKTYLHSDGRRETVETTTPCDRASGRNLCRHVVRREARGAQLVEVAPSTGRTPTSRVSVNDSSGIRTREYRPERNRSSGSSSVRRSRTMSERSSISTPSSVSSPSYSEPKTAGPMPPPLTETMSSPLERRRQPYPPIPPPGPIITEDGTAQYSWPPSLSGERAAEMERPSTSAGERTLPRQDSSFSSTKAEIGDTEPGPSKAPLKPSIKVRTDIRSSTSSSTPSVESPGLSNLPGVGRHSRKDSGKDVPQRQSSTRQVRYPSDSDRERRKKREGKRPETPRRSGTQDDRLRRDAEDRRRRDEDRSSRDEADRRRREEDDRQAAIERSRIAGSDRRQSARDELAREAARARLRDITDPPRSEPIQREASRERHRQASYAALEGEGYEQEEEYDPTQPYIDAEYEQMARERAAAARRRESFNDMPPPPQYFPDQLRREAEVRPPRHQTRPMERPPIRPRGYSYNTSPISARTPLPASPQSIRSPISARAPPMVHQYPSARHSGTIPQRGAEVLANLQARGPRGSGGPPAGLNDAFANMNVGASEQEDVEPSGDDYYYQQGQQGRSGRRGDGFWP